ncbi:superoxide dismutase, Cu-Zn family [Fodinibius salinus]|uniref:Superoxide dismutase, Cu-Zn family n=2 Tax=Fodinibius salinus TaxID=860790 RepID=A0A5D3YJ90_9BACT|nr:superoxide dismutase, Cu-Zn family [Fodinibius salinus]
MTILKRCSLGILLITFAVSCVQQESNKQQMEKDKTKAEMSTDYSKAVAVVHPTKGNDVSGSVTFTKTDDGVRVQGNLEGLTPGMHGFHIHQYGDCSASDGTSAGGHYNPAGNKHGAPTDSVRHMGDMGNIEADADGNASIDFVDNTLSLNGSNSIIGHGVILHGGQDDLTSQPSGAAGPRKACGVVGIAKAEMMDDSGNGS